MVVIDGPGCLDQNFVNSSVPVTKTNSATINDKNFADIRLKLGQKKPVQEFEIDKESVPSELSEDLWGELPKYHHHKYQEALKKEREDNKQKIKLVRETLDRQIME